MPVTTATLQNLKNQHKKFATITAYDATFAHLFDEAGISAILIGDSLGMTIKGEPNTLNVTVDEIAYHTKCVSSAVKNALVIADMPFMSYTDEQTACRTAHKLMQNGANVVKLEGGAHLSKIIRTLVENGAPVCGHLGLTPQSVNVLGGYKVQGRGEEQTAQLLKDCIEVEKAGASMIVIECVPLEIAKKISETLTIPVIGIGAGMYTDGQILVMQDALGITAGRTPSFSKNFLKETGDVTLAIKKYISEVENGIYPDMEHSFQK